MSRLYHSPKFLRKRVLVLVSGPGFTTLLIPKELMTLLYLFFLKSHINLSLFLLKRKKKDIFPANECFYFLTQLGRRCGAMS